MTGGYEASAPFSAARNCETPISPPANGAAVLRAILESRDSGQPKTTPKLKGYEREDSPIDQRVFKRRVGAYITVGGSNDRRYSSMALPMMNQVMYPLALSIVDQMEVHEADGVIFASPMYSWGPTDACRILCDRLNAGHNVANLKKIGVKGHPELFDQRVFKPRAAGMITVGGTKEETKTVTQRNPFYIIEGIYR